MYFVFELRTRAILRKGMKVNKTVELASTHSWLANCRFTLYKGYLGISGDIKEKNRQLLLSKHIRTLSKNNLDKIYRG